MSKKPVSVLLVGKGPSATKAAKHVTAGVLTAAINDSMKLFKGPVNYCFFTDIEQITAAKPYWGRVRYFICPEVLHRELKPSDASLPEGFPEQRCFRYPYDTIGCSEKAVEDKVLRREIVHHCTATAAMSWLAYNGASHLMLCGFDGGVGLAPGVHQGMSDDYNYDTFKRSQEYTAASLKKHLGVDTTWL